MADAGQTRKNEELGFCNEMLRPSELFAARSRSHKIPLRGQKDFVPDGSEPQRQRLERSLREHWDLLSEERVERIGSLVKGLWIPQEAVVELLSPAGKFWQTMGFSKHGKQFLLPEEALYLMECGSVQVFYRDLPLSIQEGYERFLRPEIVSLQQYQVFGHLKRLGYIVSRFEPESHSPSSYERQLNLPGRGPKRKRSPSPAPRQSEAQEGQEREKMGQEGQMGEKTGQEGQFGEKMDVEPEGEAVDPRSDSCPDPAAPPEEEEEEEEEGRVGERESVDTAPPCDPAPGPSCRAEQEAEPDPRPTRTSGPRWDFSTIRFPDLACRGPTPTLAPPDPALLPGSLSVGVCDIASWLGALNTQDAHLSRRERQRERDRVRQRRDVNKDKEVRRCQNWAEYHHLLERRRQRNRREPHLWEGEVKPLLQPGQHSGDLMSAIDVIGSAHWMEGVTQLEWDSEEWSVFFEVYQPDTVADFKKTSPGKPYTRMCVCSFAGPVPDLRTLKQLSLQSGDVPVTFAVVDHGDISFYTFKSFQLPSDLPH